jgi:hypothetical protein
MPRTNVKKEKIQKPPKPERPDETIIEEEEEEGGTSGFRNVCYKIFYQLFQVTDIRIPI